MNKPIGEDLNATEAKATVAQLREQLEQLIFGQEDLITEALCTFLASGHLLITGAPGLAKTTLIRVFAQKLHLSFGRIQFTPDLLPSDITGSEVLNIDPDNQQRVFSFIEGPVFGNLILADEINRASPRTQSALLESMQEGNVTVNGKTYDLPWPFMVFATQNPYESEGTFPLPEAQLDRFIMHTIVDFPDKDAEERVLQSHARSELIGESLRNQSNSQFEKSMTMHKIEQLIRYGQKISIDSHIVKAVNELVRSSRPQDSSCPESLRDSIWYGSGPRGGISLLSVCRSLALLNGEESVTWQHVRRLAKPVLRHRIRMSHHIIEKENTVDELIEALIANLEEKYQNLAQGIGSAA